MTDPGNETQAATPLHRIATAGDSGNDRDMLIGDTAGIVVANHSPELASLRDSNTHRVYFAAGRCAAGIIEGLAHYGLVSETAEHGVAQVSQAAQELAEVGNE